MTVSIDTNIKALRKAQHLTQEQLAEAMCVTVGTVSKWESGASVPDINMVVRLADFFEISVDVLLGYEKQNSTIPKAIDRIRALRNQKQFDAACKEAEKALQKFPNAFDLTYNCAILYSVMGVEQSSKKSYRRALELFFASLDMIKQNRDPEINEWAIKTQIARVYISLEKTDKALEILKCDNAEGINDELIGYILACTEHKPDEALPYLSNAFLQNVLALVRITNGYVTAYSDKKQHDRAVAISEWMTGLVRGLIVPGEPTYYVKLVAQIETCSALCAAAGGDRDGAKKHLLAAREAALAFDSAPCYDFCKSKFYACEKTRTAFDDFGSTATEAVRHAIGENADTADMLTALWNEITGTERNK